MSKHTSLIQRAARNALVLLERFTHPQGADDLRHFDHKGFLDEMERRAGRKLTESEQRSLAKLVRAYSDKEGVVL